jgi:hypothetical protein
MTSPGRDGGEPPPPAEPAKPKRPWLPPELQTGQLFEVNSMACLKAGTEPPECNSSPPESQKC